MILTDKAEEDFLKWLYSEYDYNKEKFDCLYLECSQNALIIDFFDNTGIYVNVLRYSLSEPNKWVVTKNLCENNLDFIYSSRQEATEQAIIKANEIYNNN